jgi:hypothetical protein
MTEPLMTTAVLGAGSWGNCACHPACAMRTPRSAVGAATRLQLRVWPRSGLMPATFPVSPCLRPFSLFASFENVRGVEEVVVAVPSFAFR